MRALKSGWIAPLGPEVDAFEFEVAARTARKHAVALSSGTAALHLALLALDVGPGDVVVTASMTFAATANAIVYTGAEPIFVDSDESGNIDVNLLADALSGLQRRGERISAIVAVDLLGKVADYDGITAVAAEWGVPVVSDAAESLGAYLGGRPAGTFGDIAILSFNGNKVMTTSGGGMLLTDSERIANRVRYLSTQARQPVIHYEHEEIGYNYRLSNILAAMGRAQLARLDGMIERRRQIRLGYEAFFSDVAGVELFGTPDGREGDSATRDNFWLTSVLVDYERTGWSSEDLIQWLAKVDIEARPLWKPMHLQPVFARAHAYISGTAERLFRTGVSLPSGSGMTDEDLARVTRAIEAFDRQWR